MQLTCNADICIHNKDGQCTKNSLTLNLNTYSGVFVSCDDFEETLEYVRSQYIIKPISDTEMFVKPMTVDRHVAVDIQKILNIINDKNVKTLYVDNLTLVGKLARNRYMRITNLDVYPPKFAIASAKDVEKIKEFVLKEPI